MNTKLRNRIFEAVKKVASKKAARTILNTVDKDYILPRLNLNARTKVVANTDGSFIRLYVGQRDFEFYINSGRLAGCGTLLS